MSEGKLEELIKRYGRLIRSVVHQVSRRGDGDLGDDLPAATASLARACGELVFVHMGTDNPVCRQARAAIAAAGRPDLEAFILVMEAGLSNWILDFEGAKRKATLALALAAGGPPGDVPAGIAVRIAHGDLGTTYLEEGRYNEARRELELERRLGIAAGDVECLSFADTWLCRLDYVVGDPGARAGCVRGLVEAVATHEPRESPEHHALAEERSQEGLVGRPLRPTRR